MKFTITKDGNTLKCSSMESSKEAVEIKYSILRSERRGFPNPITRREMLDDFRAFVIQAPIGWMAPGYIRWVFDLGSLRKSFPELQSRAWLTGKLALRFGWQIVPRV